MACESQASGPFRTGWACEAKVEGRMWSSPKTGPRLGLDWLLDWVQSKALVVGVACEWLVSLKRLDLFRTGWACEAKVEGRMWSSPKTGPRLGLDWAFRLGPV